MPTNVDFVLRELGRRLEAAGVVDALWVGGSLATGDYVPGVSDLDLVAVTSEPVVGDALEQVVRIHEELDAGLARGMDLGCQYADAGRLLHIAIKHPTWTHGEMVERSVSLVTRAELVLHGFPVLGPPPHELLPPVTPDDVRSAARAELAGYWSYAARRPQMFLRLPVMVDLGLTAMARGRHALSTGELLTKTAAIEQARAPRWLADDLRARRRGESTTSPRWRAAYAAWRDVRRTTSSVMRSTAP
ncbi:nucleotidyltransferase domain-containing protein [Nocardioides bizhenqiangii]|uniref:Nucleotidyltransferase domain-containing protein n=1 Tax=Nocardioides bizhenqiangii TaxID=3095076 RepID=A0ABZ0ZV75_9ACTN|nr:nucleotidyltransferase domain-containing protein [Nocardioides sp. HM61]WQQ28226.1 nucleotidyltransferase domain-containing protein [Nocardioides sp. HM61]